jgi:hypothetical protein
METIPLAPFKDVIDGIKETGGEAFKLCCVRLFVPGIGCGIF